MQLGRTGKWFHNDSQSSNHTPAFQLPMQAKSFLSSSSFLCTVTLLAALAGCGGGSSPAPLSIDPLKVDTSYGIGGTTKLNLPAPSAIALQPDGKLLLAGSRELAPLPVGNYGGAAGREVYVRRLDPDGATDTSFGKNGEVIFTVKGSDYPADIKLQKSGRIVLAVSAGEPCVVSIPFISAPCVTAAGTSAVRSSNLVALTPQGLPDATFGQNGMAETVASQNPQRLALAVKNDQSLLLLRSGGIARLQIYSRTLDMFSSNGIPDAPAPQPTPAQACEASGESLLVQNSGRIVSAGGPSYVSYAEPTVHPGVCVAAHDPKSGLQTFGAWTRFDGNYTFFSLVSTLDDGFVAVGTSCGTANCQLGIARYGANGELQPSYGQAGIARMAIPERSSITSTSVLPDDSLVVLANRVVYDSNGSNPQFGAVWMRMSPQGEPVSDFGNGGVLSTALSSIRPTHFVPDEQGRWLVVSVDRDPSGSETVLIQRTAGHSRP